MNAWLVALAAVVAANGSSADALFQSGDFAAAEAAYANALSANQRDVSAEVGLARLNLYENRLDDADALARAVLAADPANQNAARIRSTVAERQAIVASARALRLPASGISVPFVENEPLPLLQFVVDGHPGNFILDTGAPEVVLDPAFVAELGLHVGGGQSGVFAGGLRAEVRHAVVSDFRVGPVSLGRLNVAVLPARGESLFKGRKVDGVIGTVFLSRFLSTIDYPGRRLILRDRSAAPPSGTAVPMWLVGDHFIFARGSVNGVPNQLFLVDSGMAGGGFGPEQATITAAHVKTFPDKAQMGIGGGGPVRFIPVVADTLCLSTACQSNIWGMYTPGGSPAALFPFTSAGAVSHTYLEHYAVTLDFQTMRLILSS
jgi:hypothetical protein